MRRAGKSFRQVLAENRQAERAWALAFKGVVPGKEHTPPQEQVLKPKKDRVVRTEYTEHEIQTDIMSILKHHPKVNQVWRQNSGTFQMQYGDKTHYVRANTARGMSDIAGVLKGGRSLFIEVKSAKGRIAEHQQEFLDAMTAAGALAFVARSVDDVLDALENV